MKLTSYVIIIIMSGLVACGPVDSSEGVEAGSQSIAPATETITVDNNAATATPQREETAEVVPNSPLATPTVMEPDQASPENEPALTWDNNPDALVISATFCCSRVANATRLNYIPDALIWGDGRIIWTQSSDDGRRQVWEDHLTTEQMQLLLQRIDSDGFFGWQDRYADESIADAAEQCLSVELGTQSKKVCEYFAGAPQAFHDLYTYIATGAGASGNSYLPQRGYLVAYPLELPQDFKPPVDAEWPAQSVGVSLDQALTGVWLEGEALEEVWQIVNINWRGAIIQDGETYYNLSLQIPGLSQTEPPAQ